jgi:hypothetical protein
LGAVETERIVGRESELVALDWVLDQFAVTDVDRFVVGYSGGGK